MKSEDIRRALDNIEPDEFATRRMLNNILQYKEKRNGGIWMRAKSLRRVIPLALVLVLVVGTTVSYQLIRKDKSDYTRSEQRFTGEAMAEDSIINEDAIAKVENQFQLDEKHYTILLDDHRKDFGFSKNIKEEEIGELIASITKSVDQKLIGKEVYEYLPAGGKAVVAVKRDKGYELFKFFSFDSYMENKDEDAVDYLELHGIYDAKDIDKVQFIKISDRGKVEGYTDIAVTIDQREDVEKFYNYFSQLKDSSKEYFDQLYNYSNIDKGNIEPVIDLPRESIPADAPDTPVSSGQTEPAIIDTITDIKERGVGVDSITSNGSSEPVTGAGKTIEPSAGRAGNALNDSMIVRIYNKQGVYMETIYYPNINFMSRFKVNEDFANFMKNFL